MHSLHGSGASVSASNTSSGGAGPAPLPKQHHYSSRRSNSFSSASIVTVKRTGSLSSSGTAMRAQSPSDTSLIALRVSREQMSQDHKRRKSVAVDPTERASGDGLGNLNRWSQSTISSGPSGNSTRRSRASSGAVLPGFANQTLYSQKTKRSTGTIDYSPRASPHRQQVSRPASRRQQSPTGSPAREWRRPSRPDIANPLTALPPLHTIPGLTDPNDTESPSTIPTITTPSAQSSYGQDYFGDDGVSPRSTAKTKKPVMIRNHTAPMTSVYSSRLQAVEGAEEAETVNRRSDPRGEAAREAASRSKHVEEQAQTSIPSTTEKHRYKRSRTGEKGEKDKKAMLSKALQKANTAVLLDNAQNFEGALDAYGDACRLLQQVMDRSSTADDKRKLDAIRVTYTNRVEELRQLESARPETSDEKSLPTRPMSDDSIPLSPAASMASPKIAASITDSATSPTTQSTIRDIATVDTGTGSDEDVLKLSYQQKDRDSFFSGMMQAVEDSSRTVSSHWKSPSKPEAVLEDERAFWVRSDRRRSLSLPDHPPLGDEKGEMVEKKAVEVPPLKTDTMHLRPESNYMPAPLSPRRSPVPQVRPEAEQDWQVHPKSPAKQENDASLAQDNNDASGSWLDTIDERTSSRGSSVHSMSSEQGLRRKHLRGASEDSNPDFDAAFDAAVEAAYNEGLEPDLESRTRDDIAHKEHVPNEAIATAKSDIRELSPPNQLPGGGTFIMDAQDEEEERLLDEMTQDYAQSFNFDLSTKSALPRQSDSSGYSRSTWQSSQVSDRTTAGTSLSTVNEDTLPPPLSKNAFAAQSSINGILADSTPPSGPPPRNSLPKPPSMSQNRTSGVRSRRLSGQIPKQLKIETSTTKTDARKRASTFHHNQSPSKEDDDQKSAFDKNLTFGTPLEKTTSETQHERLLASPPSLDLLSAISDSSRPLTATTQTTDQRQSFDDDLGELVTHRPAIKKNQSSISLREHMVLLASPTIENGPSVVTPMSSTFMNFAPKRNNETSLTSQRAALPSFGPTAADSLYSGGGYLFDTSLAPSTIPTSPKSPGSPSGLEPCPESFLLRPFWLMRNMASTITHPKGGFLTTRLFVPREVWMTKGVKLKSIEDKIANCDLLTAALGRLAGVDTYDADAVMEELQSFEEVMERVQNSFVKKLGNDVGISGLHSLFKDASASATSGTTASAQTAESITGIEKIRSKEGKGYLNSWRKLRSKSSGAPITGGQTNKAANKAAEKEALTMSTVPMTNFVPVERRGLKKDVRNLTFEGPNREYMGSLARLFDGVQVLGRSPLFLCVLIQLQ